MEIISLTYSSFSVLPRVCHKMRMFSCPPFYSPKDTLKPFNFRLIGQVFGKCTPHNADIEERFGKVYYKALFSNTFFYCVL